MPTDSTIRRRFADFAHGQIHYRMAGGDDYEDNSPVLLLLHSSPGSSRQLVRMIDRFGKTMRVIAPDTPGNGDSDPLAINAPSIADLAAAMLQFLDSLNIPQVYVYGSHTGAAIAAELAILAPDRIIATAFDGMGHWHGEALEEALRLYAHPFEPDLDGAYLSRLFDFCRNIFLYYPWYRRTPETKRDNSLPPPADLHAFVTEVMKAGTTYHRNYRAAITWDAVNRLKLLPCKALFVSSESDPLFADTRTLAAAHPFVALPRQDNPDFAAVRYDIMMQFFGLSDADPAPQI